MSIFWDTFTDSDRPDEREIIEERRRWLEEYDKYSVTGGEMDANTLFPSNYINANDIGDGQEYTMTIHRLEPAVEMPDGEHLPVLHFERSKKGLVLRPMNTSAIIALHGPETDHWIGKPIVLFKTLKSNNKMGVAIKGVPQQTAVPGVAPTPNPGYVPPPPQSGIIPPPASPAIPADEFDDDIPF
jgi:hypothetical protein